MKLLGKHDPILAAAIPLVAAALSEFNYISHRKPAAITQITVDDGVVGILGLGRNTELTVAGTNKGTDHLIVRDGEI